MYISFGLKKFLASLPGTEKFLSGSTRSLAYIVHIIQFGLNKFLALFPGKEMINLKINILTKKGFTNLNIFLFDIIFQKIRKTVLMAIAEEATYIFL